MTLPRGSRASGPDRMPSAALADRTIATVAGRPIGEAALEARLVEHRRGPRARHIPPDGAAGSGDIRRWVARELVTEAILVHEARAAGIVGGGERLSARDLERLVAHVTDNVSVSGADARAYYERNPDLFARPESRRVRHAVFASEDAARAGAEASPIGLGDAHDVRRTDLAGPIGDAMFAAGPGSVVGPIRTELGWHVAVVDAVTPARVVPLAEARPAIEADLTAAARSRAFDEWVERRRLELVTIDPAFEHPGHPANGVPSHRH